MQAKENNGHLLLEPLSYKSDQLLLHIYNSIDVCNNSLKITIIKQTIYILCQKDD